MDDRVGQRNSGRSGADKLLKARFAGGEEGRAEETAACGELIAMGFREFLDHAMRPQVPADASGPSPRLDASDATLRGMKKVAQITIAKPRRTGTPR